MVDFNFTKILDTISPSSDDLDLVESSTNIVVSSLNIAASNSGVSVDVVAGGSTAKGTFLKGNFDIDIFVRFKSDEKNLSDILELMLADFIKENSLILERVHGSRDYFNFEFNNLFFEIIPVKFVEDISLADNVTDMSPLHVFWVKKHLTPSLCSDIRLAKQFAKSIGVYGAESFINGVSGHVLDILIIHFGGFIPFLEAVSSWSGVTVVDPENKHDDVFKELNQSKLVSPLIVIDPIDSKRNAAAAVSNDKYYFLIQKAKEFMLNPSNDFFIIPKFDIDKLFSDKKPNETLFVLDVIPKIGKKDVVITKVLKILEFISRHLALSDFDVRVSDWFISGDDQNVCHLYFFVDNKELSLIVERQGPPLGNLQGVQRFKEVHASTFERDNRLWTTVKRDFTQCEACIRHLILEDFIIERSQSVTLKIY